MDTVKTLPISTRIGTRAQRRRMVALLYLGYPIGVSAVWLSGQLREANALPLVYAAGAVAIAGILATIVAYFKLMGHTTVNLPNIAGRALDERQRRVRDGAFRGAYYALMTLVTLIGAGVLLVSIVGDNPTVAVTNGTAQVIWWAVFIVTNTLPTAIIAWNESDPDEE